MDKNNRNHQKRSYKQILTVVALFSIWMIIFLPGLKIGIDHFYTHVYSQANEDEFYEGVYINGINMSNKTRDEAMQLLNKSKKLNKPRINITVACDGESTDLTTNDFDYEIKNTEILDLVYTKLRPKCNFLNYSAIMILKVNPVRVNITAVPTQESIAKVVESIALKFDDKSVSPTVSCFNPNSDSMFTYKEGKDGWEIDQQDLENKITDIIKNGGNGNISINRKQVKNTESIETIKAKTGLISEFSTTVSNNSSRNNNIRLALSYINGKELKSGETFSFNKIVGNSGLVSRGFSKAPVLINGISIDAYGGGVCQAASTVYGAAIRANMSITERYCHSIKSSYVPVGLDATISYGSLDLKFMNESNSTVYIVAHLKDRTATCKFYGEKPKWYDEIKPVSGYITGSTNRAFAQRVFYKNSSEIYRESLPSSFYRKQ